MIILIGSINDLNKFGIKLKSEDQKLVKKFWPGPVSIIFKCGAKKFEYLHRGKKSLAFRLPKKKLLRKLIEKVGPLVAPSANPEGLQPAQNIKQAKKYFGKKVDFYVNDGEIKGKPSRIIEIRKGAFVVLR